MSSGRAKTILITSASGRTSLHVIAALLSRLPSLSPAPSIRLLVHSESSVKTVTESLASLPFGSSSFVASFVVADYLDYSSLPPAFKNVDIIFYNGPAFHPNETAMGINAVNAAKETGVKHFVYCSVLHPYLSKLLNHKAKLGVEEYLTESSLPYTILQPTSLMQNFPLPRLLDSPPSAPVLLDCPYSPTTLQGFLYLPDLAEIAANILLDPEPHVFASYPLVGENISLHSVADVIKEETARPVQCLTLDREQAKKEWGEKGARMYGEALREWSAEAWERMVWYYDKRGIPGNSNITRWLLGREPTTWRMWLKSLQSGS
ncbi:NAD P-binding protein [Gloeophyllum trabeum ATCC 11539]|uniref:NAD P-binding protein n=1 Tax=Gloeophyllum trabeum (strain ATCC 11539 / FP-39264 / Madison 617) TaxID=670483 RepID=S7PTU9_GLOTA|nr:NAD P-binding protein [Gloeophyllum trabeum ATCC 11539]EPQ50873.1 NAD P-binding protein [Gloeophyllum trabeum ATCC 11539]